MAIDLTKSSREGPWLIGVVEEVAHLIEVGRIWGYNHNAWEGGVGCCGYIHVLKSC